MHTDRSGDSETPPEVALAWYARHGFDFVVLTDHNVTGPPPDVSSIAPRLIALPGMEVTVNLPTCVPPPPPGKACLLHTTALFLDGTERHHRPLASTTDTRLELLARSVEATRTLGALAMLNHPNFHAAMDVDTVVALAARGATLIEIANEALDSENEGSATMPSTEALWDAALARGARLYGTATDDAHHYDDAARVAATGETAYVGDRGYVMVRASRDAASIRAAIENGDFYATTGLVLTEVSAGRGRIVVRSAEPDVLFELVGDGGTVLQRQTGNALETSIPPTARRYVRVRATGRDGRRAFTQPVFLPGE